MIDARLLSGRFPVQPNSICWNLWRHHGLKCRITQNKVLDKSQIHLQRRRTHCSTPNLVVGLEEALIGAETTALFLKLTFLPAQEINLVNTSKFWLLYTQKHVWLNFYVHGVLIFLQSTASTGKPIHQCLRQPKTLPLSN